MYHAPAANHASGPETSTGVDGKDASLKIFKYSSADRGVILEPGVNFGGGDVLEPRGHFVFNLKSYLPNKN